MERGRSAVTDLEHGGLTSGQHLPQLDRAPLLGSRGQQRAVGREDEPVHATGGDAPLQRSAPDGSSRMTSSPSMSPTATTLTSALRATAFTTGWMPGTSRTFSAVTGGGLSAQPASNSATVTARVIAPLWRMSIHCKR